MIDLFLYGYKDMSERASYAVFGTERLPVFSAAFRLSFDYSVKNFDSPGYVLYLEDKEQDKTFSFTYLREDDRHVSFSFNEDGKKIFHTFVCPKDELDHRWVPVSFAFDIPSDRAVISVGRHKQQINGLGLNGVKFSPVVYFGRCEYILDVASFAIRNLVVSDGKKDWVMPLNESKGEEVHDSNGKVCGQVTNPVWLINRSYYWQPVCQSYSATPSGLCFDDKRQEMLLFNQDSLSVFDLYTRSLVSFPYHNKLPFRLYLGMNFLDPAHDKLYAYEINTDRGGGIAVSGLDLSSREWGPAREVGFRQQLHHHCAFYHPGANKLILFGGYGSRKYSHTFFVYDVPTGSCDTLALSGDRITPRYFSGMAISPDYTHLYIYGGMGNESGNQNVGRNYFYDLFRVDLEKRRAERCWVQQPPAVNRVTARNMVLSEDGKYVYMLGYPEYMPNSLLQLYRITVADGECISVGDTIPLVSKEIATNANLFYNKELDEFYCSVQEFEKEGQVHTRLYALAAPPVTFDAVECYASTGSDGRITRVAGWLTACVILVTALLIGVLRYRRRIAAANARIRPAEGEGRVPSPLPEEPASVLPGAVHPADRNAVFLFGVFVVLNRHGRDITYMFSVKMRSLFLYILLNSVSGKGVLSADMNDLFWADKPQANRKNLKGVTLNHLRKILQELDGVELVFRKGYFSLVFTDECYCDYRHFATLAFVEKQRDEEADAVLIQLLFRGKFLASAESALFDLYKRQVEDFIHVFLPGQIEKAYRSRRFETTVRLCRLLFVTDRLSETALEYAVCTLRRQNKSAEALKCYASFVKDYKAIMGEEYPVAYDSVQLTN
ncbi:MAG: hypothetical protein LIP00_02575 [Parabacteroides sp.]|nr:hypothetical protein [Parabacteroides sp.]